MSRPAPVSAYNSAKAFRLRYSWQVPGDHAGTADGSACISPFSGIDCTRLCNNHLPECPRILFWLFPVLPGIFFQIRRSSLDPAYGAAGFHFGNGSFPVAVNAFLCSRYGPAHSLCCLSGIAAHGQDIPGDPLHNYKR